MNELERAKEVLPLANIRQHALIRREFEGTPLLSALNRLADGIEQLDGERKGIEGLCRPKRTIKFNRTFRDR